MLSFKFEIQILSETDMPGIPVLFITPTLLIVPSLQYLRRKGFQYKIGLF